MELPVLDLPLVQAFFVCLARTAALTAALPIIGTGSTPARIKVLFAFALTLLLFPVVRPQLNLPPFSPLGMAGLVLSEALLGIMVGFLVHVILMAVQLAGTIVGYQMGFAAANIFDPANNAQVSLMAQFNNVFAILLFFAFDVHHLFIRFMADSFRLLPPGGFGLSGAPGMYLLELMAHGFALAIQLSAPVLALLILSNISLGVMTRIFPQLNAFILSFPLNIGVSLVVMGFTLNIIAVLLQREYIGLEARILQFLQTL